MAQAHEYQVIKNLSGEVVPVLHKIATGQELDRWDRIILNAVVNRELKRADMQWMMEQVFRYPPSSEARKEAERLHGS
ncbi:MAG: hypothetical protein KGI04_04195 [Candidatus Micrarchaeota archaeon]|nr:hypothetical protein [Candidatus Micrarchaeota archaeon]